MGWLDWRFRGFDIFSTRIYGIMDWGKRERDISLHNMYHWYETILSVGE